VGDGEGNGEADDEGLAEGDPAGDGLADGDPGRALGDAEGVALAAGEAGAADAGGSAGNEGDGFSGGAVGEGVAVGPSAFAGEAKSQAVRASTVAAASNRARTSQRTVPHGAK
jgi:hypothetical protein